jgi:hypothetical protein
MACNLDRSVAHEIEATPTDVATSPTMAWRVSPRDLVALSDALPLFPKVRRGALAGSEAAGHWPMASSSVARRRESLRLRENARNAPMAGYRAVAERRLDVLAEEASAGRSISARSGSPARWGIRDFRFSREPWRPGHPGALGSRAICQLLRDCLTGDGQAVNQSVGIT